MRADRFLCVAKLRCPVPLRSRVSTEPPEAIDVLQFKRANNPPAPAPPCYSKGMETNKTNDGPMTVTEMLSRINRFYDGGKLSASELDKAAENIARCAEEDPTMLSGTSFEELTKNV